MIQERQVYIPSIDTLVTMARRRLRVESIAGTTVTSFTGPQNVGNGCAKRAVRPATP